MRQTSCVPKPKMKQSAMLMTKSTAVSHSAKSEGHEQRDDHQQADADDDLAGVLADDEVVLATRPHDHEDTAWTSSTMRNATKAEDGHVRELRGYPARVAQKDPHPGSGCPPRLRPTPP